MFFTIEPHQHKQHRDLLDEMFRIRAKVFSAELGWDVSVVNGRETDAYDRCSPAYLLWTDEQKQTLFGSVRLLPTTGPTLLYDVFRNTFPDDLNLSAPGIWEGTRLCIHAENLSSSFPALRVRDGYCLMLLALCETALKHGIHTLISNFEPPTRRLYKAAGAPLHELGSSGGFGKRPVCAGLFPVKTESRRQMRTATGIQQTLLDPGINRVLRKPPFVAAA